MVHGYARYVPQRVRDSIENFVDNFDRPSSMVNHLLVGDLKGPVPTWAASPSTPLWACSVCSMWPPPHAGLARNTLEMDTVLGKADIGDGAYLMVPVCGPTTTRQLVGDTIDTIYFPYALLTFPLYRR